MKIEDVKSGQFFRFKNQKSIYIMGFDEFAVAIIGQKGKVIDGCLYDEETVELVNLNVEVK